MSYERIIVAVDDTEAGKRAFAAALPIAKSAHSQLFLVSVIEDLAQMAGETIGQVEDRHAQAITHFEWTQRPMLEHAQREGVEATSHILLGRMVERFLELARERSADLIVLGGFGRPRLMGLGASRGYDLADRVSCAVLIAK